MRGQSRIGPKGAGKIGKQRERGIVTYSLLGGIGMEKGERNIRQHPHDCLPACLPGFVFEQGGGRASPSTRLL